MPVLHLTVTAGNGQTVANNTCSPNPVSVQVQNSLNQPVTQGSNLTVSLSSSPPGLQFFAAAGCPSPVANVQVLMGNNSTSFWFKSSTPQNPYTVNLGANGVTGTTTTATVQAAQAAKLVFINAAHSNVPAPLNSPAGFCRALQIQQQDAASQPVLSDGTVMVSLSSSPTVSSGPAFFSNANCSGMPVTSVAIPNGASQVTVYVSAYTGTSYTLTATSGALVATQPFSVKPLVRRGICTTALDPMTPSGFCPIAPLQTNTGNTVLFFQAVSSGSNFAATSVECHLTGANNQFSCRRVTTGVPGVAITIYWQTLEIDTGLTVNRALVNAPNDGGTFASALIGAGGNFVTISQAVDAPSLGPATMPMAQRSGGGVVLEWQQPPSPGVLGYQVAVQLVTMMNAKDQGATSAIGLGMSSGSVSMAPPTGASGTPFVLSSQNLVGGGTTELCSRAARAESSGNVITFTRGNGASSPACTDDDMTGIYADRVWPAAPSHVEQVTTSMLQGDASASVMLSSPVDVTRTLVFASNQLGGGGQGAGESALNSGNPIGDAIAGHVLDGGADFTATQLFLIRGSTLGSAKWTSYVVEFGP